MRQGSDLMNGFIDSEFEKQNDVYAYVRVDLCRHMCSYECTVARGDTGSL